jgi:methylase of polypeptide subunit release factors
MAIDPDYIASQKAASVAAALLEAARQAHTEADFRREAAQIFHEAAVAAGLDIVPKDEFSVARGRVDSVYNRLILEYKRPGVLKARKDANPNREAVQQVKEYILNVAKRDRREASRLAGVVTDGYFVIIVRRVGEGWAEDDPVAVNAATAGMLLRLLFSLAVGAALVPENLVEDFGPKHVRARHAVRALYRAQSTSKHPLVAKLFEQWREFFSEATDYKEWAERIKSKVEFRSFVASIWTKEEIKHLDAARVFFVLHTYYALLIKLVASLAAARFAGGSTTPLAQLAAKTGDDLRDAFRDLERGGLFREYGIRNFLEGDFFGWYLAAWNEDIEEAIRPLVGRLAEYDPGTLELAPENARDLLKKLYHYLLPREIRHDLGEYYTPDWLAERLLIQTLGKADLGDATKRVLDPACGSGTFLVILIKYIRERSERNRRDPAETLRLILQNVVGIDLNPLAVIAARTNVLLALGDLLKHRKGDIDIPVYQADSVLTPSQGSGLFDGDVYLLRTSAGVFRIPSLCAGHERMDALANTLDEAVESEITEKAFLSRVTKTMGLEPEEVEAAGEQLQALYRQLRELHREGLNGVWARIIKNAFAPIFLEPCHYIVGNPPWVNWEHLPDEYRRNTMPLWQHYGLFPKRETGLETILGAAKYDISMLLTYVAIDRYLTRNGKLGFVLTQSLFKTTGAGQGFRAFALPGNQPFGPALVEDMVELKPFEGAANRTAVAVFIKGYAVRYPVSYQYWMKRETGRGKAIGFDTPYEEVTSSKITFRSWFAQPVDSADPTSAWITASRKVLAALRKMAGTSPFVGRKGVTASANGVFWLDVVGRRPGGQVVVTNVTDSGKIPIARTQAAVESELVYPLLRGRDVSRWRAVPEISILLTHEKGMRLKAIPEESMQSRYPKAWHYLARYRDVLRKTGLFKRFFRPTDPFYSVFNIGDYTFAANKLVIREIAGSLTCAVAPGSREKPVIPDHKLISVDASTAQEAHYLCAVLNSIPARVFVGAYCIETQFSSHIFDFLAIPAFSSTNRLHRRLAQMSEAAHSAVEHNDEKRLRSAETEIGNIVGQLWQLTEGEIREIQAFSEGTT